MEERRHNRQLGRTRLAPMGRQRSACGSLWVEVAGAEACLRRSGALWLEAAGTLIAGDLHLEKGSAYAARGQLLPPYDTRATLDRLEAEIVALDPTVVVLLGDSFHDARATGLAWRPTMRRGSPRWRSGRTLVWVVGNHDEDGPGALPGEVADEVEIAGLTLRHEPTAGPARGEVAGHLHPCAKLVANGRVGAAALFPHRWGTADPAGVRLLRRRSQRPRPRLRRPLRSGAHRRGAGNARRVHPLA